MTNFFNPSKGTKINTFFYKLKHQLRILIFFVIDSSRNIINFLVYIDPNKSYKILFLLKKIKKFEIK